MTTAETRSRSGVWRGLLPTMRRDVALAAVAVVSALPDLASQASRPWPVFVACLAAGLLPALAVAWRDRLEARLLVVAIAGSTAAAVLGAPDTGLPALIALATISLRRTWRTTAIGWAGAVTALALPYVARPAFAADPVAGLGSLLIAALFAGIVAAVGLYFGARRAHVRSLEERNAALERERELLERERELLAREAIAVERARIARELHDVVAHHVSVMVIQAGAAEATLPPGADTTLATLEAVRETGREALAEMRRLLGILRDPAVDGKLGIAPPADPDGNRDPQPGVAQLPVLIARIREAGVRASLEYAGPARRLPPGIDLSVYRIAQEALTNTLRHAGRGATACVALSFEPAAVAVEITDDGLGTPEPEAGGRIGSGGHGLVGMRERVGLFGGTLEAGPARGGGFRVIARFPLETSEAGLLDVRPAEAHSPSDRSPGSPVDHSPASPADPTADLTAGAPSRATSEEPA